MKPDVVISLEKTWLTIGSPKMCVEIFTLAHGARACIESTQFIIIIIIICHNNKLSRRIFGLPMVTLQLKEFSHLRK
jgi:hypothetical protein